MENKEGQQRQRDTFHFWTSLITKFIWKLSSTWHTLVAMIKYLEKGFWRRVKVLQLQYRNIPFVVIYKACNNDRATFRKMVKEEMKYFLFSKICSYTFSDAHKQKQEKSCTHRYITIIVLVKKFVFAHHQNTLRYTYIYCCLSICQYFI